MLKTKLLAAGAALAIVAGIGGVAAVAQAQAPTPAPAPAVPTTADALAFIAKAETDLAALSQYVNRASWVRATYITEDTQWLEAKAGSEITDLATRLAIQAAQYDKVAVDPVTRRKLDILKRALVAPAPQRPGAADEMATIASRLDSTYSTGKFTYKGKTLTLNDAEDILAKEWNGAGRR